MIGRLRRRMTLLVIGVVVCVTAGIVLAISLVNLGSIGRQAYAALETLSARQGARMAPRGPRLLDTDDAPSRGGFGTAGRSERGRARIGQPMDLEKSAASLSNTYTIRVNSQGTVQSWTSDRADLYSDEQVQALTDAILEKDAERGRIGTQFYILKRQQDTAALIIVLDSRLEKANARRVTLITAAVGLAACLLLTACAVWLIRRMVRPVEEAFARQRQFVSDASHELKTPLAVIKANAQVLSGDIGANENLGYIQAEVDRAGELVASLLTLARLDQGSVRAKREPYDLARAVRAEALPFESAAFEAGRRLSLEGLPETAAALGDEGMTRQLVLILLDNALKYGDDRGPISVRILPGTHMHCLQVANTGEDIAADALPHLFDRFYRADAAHGSQTDGYGLGLSIARSVAVAQGGRISVSSRGGETVFTVMLPAAHNG